MSAGIILVRHAMPEVDRSTPSKQWRLGDSAREDSVLLAHALPDTLGPVIVSSPEPKTLETARVIALRLGIEVIEDHRLGEVNNPWPRWDGYREAAAAYLAGEATPPGWEERGRVLARFAAAVRDARLRYPAGDLLVANHGMAMAIYLASIARTVVTSEGERPFDLVPFWQGLTFPDAWRLEGGTLRRLFNGGLPGG